ncbi:MAG: protease Lon-related BREX system protein BrxL [Burkholderiales bacterium]|nr:protease Lon-related BREX system protein BrxL [Burkholderiales bacterium]
MISDYINLDTLLNQSFAGKVVRKDLTKKIKEGANVPVYVLEYLLGGNCTSEDSEIIQQGLETVKRILAENYVRPEESEKIKSLMRERGSYKIIDKVTVRLNEKKDIYQADLANLGISDANINGGFVKRFEKLLVGGIWCIINVQYNYQEGSNLSPFMVSDVKPIQMPNMDLQELFNGRRAFSTQEWQDVLIRSTGMEPTNLDSRTKWHLLARMIPFVENNYNMCELGPRGTGKSHIYKEVSPNSILVSGGQTTVANLFYNMARRTVGLVANWDVVAFDEVAGINFKDKDGIQIMKDFMASGSFARGKDQVSANASMVFVGNINQSVDTLVKTSHLLVPFPEAMIDCAFFDRFHAYIPGWEIPKMRPEFFTNYYGLITDYLAEFMAQLRKYTFADVIDKYFKLGSALNQRDTIAVKKTVSGLMKLIYPNGEYSKEDIRAILEYALELRRRVKEQLKKIGGLEFSDVHFSYIDLEYNAEYYVTVPEQSSGKLIPEGISSTGNVYTVARGANDNFGLYLIELQKIPGNGGITIFNANQSAKQLAKIGLDVFKANVAQILTSAKSNNYDYKLNVVELHNSGSPSALSLVTFISLCSSIAEKPLQSELVVLGEISLGGTVKPVENLAECLQIAHDSGAKKILLPMSSAVDIPTIPVELFTKFTTLFYSDPKDAVYKALGIN